MSPVVHEVVGRLERSRRPTIEEWWTYDIKQPPTPPPPKWPWFALAAIGLMLLGAACALVAT
jgi:hypothetical protein